MLGSKTIAVSGQDAAKIQSLHEACQQLLENRDADLSDVDVAVAACAKWVCNVPPFGQSEDVAGQYAQVTVNENQVVVCVPLEHSLPTLGRFLQGVVELTSVPALSIVVARYNQPDSLTGECAAVAIVARKGDWQLLSLEAWIKSTLENKPLKAAKFAGARLARLAQQTVCDAAKATPEAAAQAGQVAQGAVRKAYKIAGKVVRRNKA